MRGVDRGTGEPVDRIVYARLADRRAARTSRRASARCSTPSSPASARSARCWSATPTAGCCCASSPTSRTGTCPAAWSRSASRRSSRSRREVEEELGADHRGRRRCCSPTGCRRGAAGTTRSAWSSTAACTTPPSLDGIVPQAREIRSAEFCTLDEVRERCADFTARRIEAALAARSSGGGPAYTESGPGPESSPSARGPPSGRPRTHGKRSAESASTRNPRPSSARTHGKPRAESARRANTGGTSGRGLGCPELRADDRGDRGLRTADSTGSKPAFAPTRRVEACGSRRLEQGATRRSAPSGFGGGSEQRRRRAPGGP